MTRWHLVVSEKTDRSVRSYLASTGEKKGDLSKFVDEAVRREVLRRTIGEIHEQNRDADPAEAEALVDEAVAWERASRR